MNKSSGPDKISSKVLNELAEDVAPHLTSIFTTSLGTGRISHQWNTVLVAPITRSARGIPTEVGLDEVDGMPVPCVATLDNLTTVPKSFLTERITRLSRTRLHEVCIALSVAVDC